MDYSPDTFERSKVSKTRRAGDSFSRDLRYVLRCKNKGPHHLVTVILDLAGSFYKHRMHSPQTKHLLQ